MMITEHRKCGGRGWHLYDSAFCQQITSLETSSSRRERVAVWWHCSYKGAVSHVDYRESDVPVHTALGDAGRQKTQQTRRAAEGATGDSHRKCVAAKTNMLSGELREIVTPLNAEDGRSALLITPTRS